MTSLLTKSKEIIGAPFQTLFFYSFLISLMFLDIQIDLIILKSYDQQFTFTTKKSLHIIFKGGILQLHVQQETDCPMSINIVCTHVWACVSVEPLVHVQPADECWKCHSSRQQPRPSVRRWRRRIWCHGQSWYSWHLDSFCSSSNFSHPFDKKFDNIL